MGIFDRKKNGDYLIRIVAGIEKLENDNIHFKENFANLKNCFEEHKKAEFTRREVDYKWQNSVNKKLDKAIECPEKPTINSIKDDVDIIKKRNQFKKWLYIGLSGFLGIAISILTILWLTTKVIGEPIQIELEQQKPLIEFDNIEGLFRYLAIDPHKCTNEITTDNYIHNLNLRDIITIITSKKLDHMFIGIRKKAYYISIRESESDITFALYEITEASPFREMFEEMLKEFQEEFRRQCPYVEPEEPGGVVM